MKISELQEIIEHYKKENGDLEVRVVIDTRCGEQYDILDHGNIGVQTVYDEEEFDYLINNMGLTKQQALDNLKERELATTYLDIYTYIK